MFGGSISALKLPVKKLITVKTQGKIVEFVPNNIDGGNKIMLMDIQFIGQRDIEDFIKAINNPKASNIYLGDNTDVNALFDSFDTDSKNMNIMNTKSKKSKKDMKDKKKVISSKRNDITDYDSNEGGSIKYTYSTKSNNISNNSSVDCFDSIYKSYLGDDIYWYNIDYNDDFQTFAGEYIYAGGGVAKMRRAPVITVYEIKEPLRFLQVLSEPNYMNSDKLPFDIDNNYMVYRNMLNDFSSSKPSPHVYVVGNPTKYLKPVKHYIFTEDLTVKHITKSVISTLQDYKDSLENNQSVLSSKDMITAIESIVAKYRSKK